MWTGTLVMCAENRETLRENKSEGKEERKRKKERKLVPNGGKKEQGKSRRGGTNPKSTIEMGRSFHFPSPLIGRFPTSFPSLLSIWFSSIVCILPPSISSFYSFSLFFFLFFFLSSSPLFFWLSFVSFVLFLFFSFLHRSIALSLSLPSVLHNSTGNKWRGKGFFWPIKLIKWLNPLVFMIHFHGFTLRVKSLNFLSSSRRQRRKNEVKKTIFTELCFCVS